MTIKQLILGALTLVVVVLIGISLLSSWTKPQIQSQLQLYQTNLLLQAAEWQPEGENMGATRDALIGADPLKAALSQYQEVRQSAQATLGRLSEADQPIPSELNPELGSPPVRRSPEQQLQQLINQLDLRLGLLYARLGQTDQALQTWTDLLTRSKTQAGSQQFAETAAVLTGLWSTPPRLLPDAEQQLRQLNGWFREQALAQLYQLQQRQDVLTTLQTTEQEMAENALVRLLIVGGMPLLGSLVGLGLLVVWVVRVTRQKQSQLSTAKVAATWPVIWGGETIWQVMVLWFIAFFGISLFLVPLFVKLLGLNPATFSARAQTFVALCSYAGLMIAGLSILYVCLKPFLPHPGSWFRISWQGNWLWWGLSGYLAALPLVIAVSLINQRLLQEQGGGNPLLEVIIQSRDGITMAVLFLMVAVLAPFFEETLFRGFLLPSLTRYLPTWGAIAASGLLFAIAHLNLSDILPLTVLGMVLGFVYLRSGNLLASMLLHSIWNSGSFLGLLILSGGAG